MADRRRKELWHPPEYTRQDARALQSIVLYGENGENPPSPEECARALNWIIHKAAMTYEETFAPNQDDVRCYVSGRRSVGLAIVKLMKLKPESIPNE